LPAPGGSRIVAASLGAGMGEEDGSDFISPEWFDTTLEWVSLGAEAIGVMILVAGGMVALYQLVKRLSGREPAKDAIHAARVSLATSILLGLEFLVAADIIETIAVGPNLTNLAVLAVIVLIRIVLSFALELEIQGRWPWQRDRSSE